MWVPVDIAAVPAAQELVKAKLAIEQVESELKDALLSLEQAQLRVANLEKDLEERRAWIAPIRRLSFDVLSLIFEFCGEDNWRTSLRISGVSRLWRALVLATPRAWAFLHVHECGDDDDDLINQFFQHCGQRPLHVFLSKSQHLTTLTEVAEKLECLSANEPSQIEEILVFPKLKHLSLRSVDKRMDLSNLSISRFPALQELICQPTIITVAVSVPSSIKVTFPPLQVLSIATEGDHSWLEVLMGCRSTLVSLQLHIIDENPDSTRQARVLLPMLRGLDIHLWDYDPDIWPVIMRTPALETYIEQHMEDAPVASPVHKDVGTVTQIHLGHQSNLSAMTLLHIIRLDENVDIASFLSQLQSSRSLCPRLEMIEVMRARDLAPYEASLVEVNKERSQPISMRNVKTWVTVLPYEISRYPVSNWFSTCIPNDLSASAEETCRAVENKLDRERPRVQGPLMEEPLPRPSSEIGSYALAFEGGE